jgi:AcrR family transcriptional regulator
MPETTTSRTSKHAARAKPRNAPAPRAAKAPKELKEPLADKRRRMTPGERRDHILKEAIHYFSEVGFDGSTRELAVRIGVKQPLLYRYFPSKDDLIRDVYEAVYISRWTHDWDRTLRDRSLPLRTRLISFYTAYAEIMFEPEWIRIFMFSGLKGLDINKRYTAFMEERVLSRVCEEIRESFAMPSVSEVPVRPEELAAFWVFHGGIFYHGVRREVYDVPMHVDLGSFIEYAVDSLLSGLPSVMKAIQQAQ